MNHDNRQTMQADRVHRYCGGKGFVRLASGADGHCFGCNGTGRIEVVSAEERRARKAANGAYQAAYAEFVRLKRADAAPPAGMTMSDYRAAVMQGFEALAEREPGRLPALYASLANGRTQAVADALAVYGKNAAGSMYESAYCVRCHRDTLPLGQLCDRTERADLGPEQPEGINSRYEGLCLRCCDHNHG